MINYVDADEEAIERLRLDPDGPPVFALILGRKGSGKSTFLKQYASAWPYDELIVDPTKDLDPDHRFTRPWPGGDRWPERDEELDRRIGHRRFRVVPNRDGNPKHREDVDSIVKLAHNHPEPTFIGIDEGRYLFASDDKILPGSDIVQNEGRHGPDFLFVANPRAVGLRPVLFVQADWIVLFALGGDADIKRAAEHTELAPDELAEALRSLDREPLGERGEIVTGFLLIDKTRETITRYPILPVAA